MIRNFKGFAPKVALSAYVDASAQVIGDVTRRAIQPVAERAARGDVHPSASAKRLTFRTTPSCIATSGFPLMIGNRVTVGHLVMLHGCTVEDDALIGIGAIVLNGAKIGKGSVVAAGALVPEAMEVPPGVTGDGRSRQNQPRGDGEEQERFAEDVQHYVEKPCRVYTGTMIKAVKGTRDILPPSSAVWNHVEAIAREVFRTYNYHEIRTPILEETALFARGVGEDTDIVSKEMYTFRGSRRQLAHAAAGGHRLGDARIHRAPARSNPRRAKALLHWADVSPRAPAKRPLPAVFPDWRGGHRLGFSDAWTPK